MGAIFTVKNFRRRVVAAIATAALAITSQTLISISANAVEADSAASTIDYAGVYDGTTRNDVVATSDTVIPTSTAFTAEAWIYPTAAATEVAPRVIMSQGTTAAGEFWIARDAGVIKMYRDINAGGVQYLLGPAPTNAWTHIAVSMDGSYLNAYINGALAFSKLLPFGVNIAPKFAIGSWTNDFTNATTYWQGQIDQVKVWNAALTESQVAQSMHDYQSTNVTSAPTLLAHYDFNEGSNTDQRVYNRAGANLDLTSSSALTYTDVKTIVNTGNIDGNRTLVYKFPRTYLTAQGGWTVTGNMKNVEVLTVGGGGGGGENVGNGGSGGSSTYHSGLSLTAGDVLAVKVGQGGHPGVYVDDTMVGSSTTIWQRNSSGINNTAIASAQRDGGDGQASSLSIGSTMLTAPGGLGGMTYWDNNQCAGAGHTAADTSAGAVGSGGTANNVGGAGGQGSTTATGTAGTSAATSYTISGSSYKFGGGGAGADGRGTPSAVAGGADGGASTVTAIGTRGNDGTPNSGGGGSGGLTSCTPGGAGGSGVVYVRTLPVSVSAITGGAGSTKSVAAVISGPTGNFSLTLSSTVGTFNILAGDLTASAATKTGGSGTDKFITYQGTIEQIRAAVAATKYLLNGTPTTGTIKVELNPVIANSGTTYLNAANSHYYKAVTSTQNWASAKSSAENTGNNLLGLNGYLSNVTSAAEKDFIYNNIATTTMWSGGYYNGTNWLWEGGPEAGTVFWNGIALGSAVAGQYANWGTGEPNGTQDRVVVNWTSANGVWDNQDNTVLNTSLVEYGGRATDPGVASANVTVTMTTVNVAYTELNFDYTAGKYINLKSLGSVAATYGTTAGSSITATTSTGKLVGDRVLFKAVTVRDGKTIDALVTTRSMYNTTIATYENANSGGTPPSFQSDVSMTGTNGYAEFQFDFFETDANIEANCNAAITCAGSNKVILQNVNVSLWDIDYNQWNEATGMDSYTVASTTYIKSCLASSLTISTTCTVDTPVTTFPNSVRFQGRSGYTMPGTTIPEDMVILNYGSIESFRVKLGKTLNVNPNLYGITFKALSWGSTTPVTYGPPAVNYDIVYDGNGKTSGTVPATQTGALGSNVTIATNSGNLVRTGYVFGGWNTAADGSGTSFAAGEATLIPLNGMTLYAVWTPNVYTLTYNANGGSAAPAATTNNAGASITLSASVPTRSGYTFAGWNTLANGTGTNYNSSASYTMPGANTTLYAKWTAATSTIAYDGNSATTGTAPANNTGTSGAATTVAGNTGTLTKTGYTFSGWNTAANGSGTDYSAASAINYPASGTTTLYAKWTAVSYTLAYNSNGGSAAPASGSQAYGTTVTVAAAASNPTRSGYTFTGWNTAANGTGTPQAASSTFSMPANNVTLYAQWTAINYNVTYNGNAPSGQSVTGSQTDATNYNTGGTVTVLNAGTLAVSGYRFLGWNTQADGLGSDYIAGATLTMPTGGITLYAKWVLSSIKLTYDANGGAGAPPADTHSAGSSINLSTTVPTRSGYTFGGWNTLANGNGTNYASNASYVVPGSDTVLYAKWTAINYTLSYSANGGSGAPANLINQIVNTIITLSNTIPTWIGYTFLGWNTAANGSGTDYLSGASFTMPASDTTLYAKWQGNPFTLFYNGNSGGNISPSSEARSAGTTGNISSSVPTRTGYTFAGWNTAANGSGTAYTAGAALSMPGSNVTLYAQWTAVSSAVAYDANGGTGAPAGSNASIGQTVTVSNGVPSRTGYTFTGWNTAANGSGTPYSATDTFTMGANSVTLYAQWTTTSYAVTYDANGGSGAPGSQNKAYAATVTVSSTLPTFTGNDFLGWNTQANGLGTTYAGGATFSMPASNVTLYAQWSLGTYTVYYNANGGNGSIPNQAGRYNTGITLSSTVPARTGFTFSGWNTSPDGSGTSYASSAAFTIPSSNTILYAQWTAITYVLSYDANSGTGAPANVTGVTYAQSVTLSAIVPTRSGYYFTGWNTQVNGSGQSYAVSTAFVMPASNATLYAQWSLNTYSVSYNANGGNGAPGSQQTSGGNVTVPNSTPTRPGYTFNTWSPNPGGGGSTQAPNSTFAPSGNTVLYAQWTANTITISYNINGGTGATPPSTSGTYGNTVQLEGSLGFTKANSLFISWNTLADGTGTNYQADDPAFTLPTSDITLYAIWSGTNFAIEYKPNGGANAPGTQYATPGNNVNLAPSEPTKSGYDFAGWQEVSTGNVYSAGAGLTMPTSNLVMVARWITRASVPREVPTPTPTPTTPVVTTPKKLTFTVYFKGDSAVLTAATKAALKQLAVKANAFGRASSITVIGRVKETNDKSYDMRLSKQRATNVAAYLRKLGVTGTYSVIAAGISPENKAISRRVDGTLIWKAN